MLQRLVTGAVLLYHLVTCLSGTHTCAQIVPQTVAALAGTFLLFGLWTPIAGTVVAIADGWILWWSAGNSATAGMLAVMGATLAMIGPGAWSIDARLFGRKHIEASKPSPQLPQTRDH